MIKGIDVSHHNGSIDWAKVKADGVKFTFIKATQGVGYSKVDYFRNHAPKALGNGIHVGAYHYATFSNIPEALSEAKYFYSVIKDYKLTYPLVLDLEENKDNASRKQLTAAANAFMEFLENKGYKVMLYTSKGFLDYELDKTMIDCPLWIARYNKELGMTADIWQHTDKGKVNGIGGYVDMNWGYRDFAPQPKASSSVIGTITVTADRLNVRKGPDIKEPVVKTIKKGEKYKAYGIKYGWYNVGAGWVSQNYVTFKK
jgi:lysozyme